jgi:hypothetical protein
VNTGAVEDSAYFRAALSNQYNLILFAGSALFAAALASWAPLVAGAAGEALWLVVGPRLQAFRQRTDERRQRRVSDEAIDALPSDYAERVRAVERDVSEIEVLCASHAGVTREERAEVSRRLSPLVPRFLEICAAHVRLRRVTAHGQPGDLTAELSTLNQSLTSESDLGVRASLRRALTVTQRRIKQLEGNDAACRSIELAMQTITKSLSYLKECAAGMNSVAELCAEIDSAVAQLGHVAALEHEQELEVAQRSSLPPMLN